METNRLYRGRLIDHIQLVVKDLAASRRFYQALFAELGIPLGGEGPNFFWYDELFIASRNSDQSLGELTGRVHLAFQAADQIMVERCHAAALAAGGRDNGAPGERSQYHPGYYGAFMLDPDGNNIEAVYHGEAQRSAAAIRIDF